MKRKGVFSLQRLGGTPVAFARLSLYFFFPLSRSVMAYSHILLSVFQISVNLSIHFLLSQPESLLAADVLFYRKIEIC